MHKIYKLYLRELIFPHLFLFLFYYFFLFSYYPNGEWGVTRLEFGTDIAYTICSC